MSTTTKSRLRVIANWVKETWAEGVYAQERLLAITGIRGVTRPKRTTARRRSGNDRRTSSRAISS
jgi:hypothetical protein